MLALSCWQATAAAAEAPDSIGNVVDSIAIQAIFPIGVGDYDPSYSQNASHIAKFLERLHSVEADPTIFPSQIRIVGCASPDGSYQFNLRLARKRAESLAAYIRTHIDIPDSLIQVESVGIDWQGLDRAVGKSSLANKERVQEIIRNEPEVTYDSRGNQTASRKQKLQSLDGGRTWAWMMKHLYPALRSSASVVCYIQRVEDVMPLPVEEPIDSTALEVVEVEPDTVATAVLPEVVSIEDSTEVVPLPAVEVFRYPIFALRSNLLVPLLNVGVEVPIGNRWSVGVDYYYPWLWRKADHKNCFELIFLSAEARYWFGSNHTSVPDDRQHRLTGHSVGLYGAWGYYDFEHNYHGYQGHGYSAGIDYLFAMPIAKGRMHLEFQAAIGGVYSPAQPYNVKEAGGLLIREHGRMKRFSYFGPTKLAVSLVVPFFRSEKRIAPTVEP